MRSFTICARRAPWPGPDELAAFETDTLAGLVLARAAAGLADSTIVGEVIHLEQVRAWLLRPLMAADQAQAPPELRQALDVISQHVDDYISRARIGKAA